MSLTTTQKLARTLILIPVRLYQRIISPALPPTCRYAPSCSTYAIHAISEHGILKGSILATWRILRCNPWSRGGVDHIPEKGHWKPQPWEPPADWVGHNDSEWIPMGLPDEFLEHTGDTSIAHTTDLPVAAGQSPKTPSSTNVRSHECSN